MLPGYSVPSRRIILPGWFVLSDWYILPSWFIRPEVEVVRAVSKDKSGITELSRPLPLSLPLTCSHAPLEAQTSQGVRSGERAGTSQRARTSQGGVQSGEIA